MTDLRETARRIFVETLARVDVRAAMERRVSCVDGVLRCGGLSYRLREFRRVAVVAIGKAAEPMAEVVRLRLAGWGVEVAEIVVAPGVGGHPVPDAGSLTAAERVLRLLRECDREDCLVVFLMSGGASAMVEMPLDPGMSMEDVAGFHRALVHSGLGIRQMNVLRKHVSAVKGGRLAVAAGRAAQCTLVVSDVPRGALDAVGSGPSLPDPSTMAECRELARGLALPERVVEFLAGARLVETPKWDHPAFRKAAWEVVLSSDDLAFEAAAVARQMGFHVAIDNGCDEWGYAEAAEYLLERLEQLRLGFGRVCLLSAGEIAVKVAGECGVGGRNQHFVLEAARRLAGERAAVLSAGSDGVDGSSPAAGGVGDGTTVQRAEAMGIDVAGTLAVFDSYTLLRSLGDCVATGPTGNNLRDLRVLLAG